MFVTIARALGDEGRVRIVMALRKGELCACQLTELLDLAPSTVSKHLMLLKQAGLLRSRKKGTWILYSINEGVKGIKPWLKFLHRATRGERRYQDDRKRLSRILTTDPAILCSKQKRRIQSLELWQRACLTRLS